ncbi:Fc.00g084270.m01.CDS01 [Cosmosporella sp. VM-42]
MRSTDSKPTSFATLPNELIHLFCEKLCPRCSGLPFENDETDEESGQASGLKALCVVSRDIRDIAQPHLFHRPRKFTRLIPFIEVLVDRPDLAANVKEYRCCGDSSILAWKGDTNVDYFKAVARSRQLDIDGDPEFDDLYRVDEVVLVRFLNELAIALLPGLEVLLATLNYDGFVRYPTRNRYLARRFKRIGPDRGLVGLRTIDLVPGDVDIDTGFSLSTPGVTVLLGASPDLTSLRLSGLTSFYNSRTDDSPLNLADIAPALQGLRSLEISRGAIDDDRDKEYTYLRDIMTLCPSLNHFRYHAASTYIGERINHIPAARFLKTLEPQKRTLEHLDLDLCDAITRAGYLSAESCQIGPSKLKQFTVLKTLKLDEGSFCRHWFPIDQDGFPEEKVSCLTQILGPSVESLVVNLADNGYAVPDIIHLGREVGEGKFPGLRSLQVIQVIPWIHFAGWEGRAKFEMDREKILETFELTDVSISVEGPVEFFPEA